jgi:hypothetical protein
MSATPAASRVATGPVSQPCGPNLSTSSGGKSTRTCWAGGGPGGSGGAGVGGGIALFQHPLKGDDRKGAWELAILYRSNVPRSSPASARSGASLAALDPKGHHDPRKPFTGLNFPYGITVSTAGDVFVTDSGNGRVLKLPAGSDTQVELPFTGLDHPYGVAVNSAGDVFVADSGNGRVLKLPAGSDTQVELPFTGFDHLNPPNDVAVDSAGNVYAVDSLHKRVHKLPTGSNAQIDLSFGDGVGNPEGESRWIPRATSTSSTSTACSNCRRFKPRRGSRGTSGGD